MENVTSAGRNASLTLSSIPAPCSVKSRLSCVSLGSWHGAYVNRRVTSGFLGTYQLIVTDYKCDSSAILLNCANIAVYISTDSPVTRRSQIIH